MVQGRRGAEIQDVAQEDRPGPRAPLRPLDPKKKLTAHL